MTVTLTVAPGIDMSAAMHTDNARLTKKWLREYLRDNPQKDFRVLGGPGARPGSYVNGGDAVRYDLSLQVRHPTTLDLVAVVDFQSDADANDWGYQAVVR